MEEKDKLGILREVLQKLETVGDLDRHLKAAGGIALDDDTFQVYLDEYKKRGWSLPP